MINRKRMTMNLNNGKFLDRTTMLVDLENGCGCAALVPCYQSKLQDHLLDLAGPGQVQVIYATGPRARELSPTLLWDWGRHRYLCGHGLNGADLALINFAEKDPAIFRSARVVIVSGDGIFAPLAAALAAQGIQVTVVARRGSLSAALRLVAHKIEYLPEFGIEADAVDAANAIEGEVAA
jgi:hypothetical protein